MSLDTLMTRTATIIRRTQTGTAGRTNTPTWVASAPFDVKCYLEQSSQTEVVIGRETQIIDATIVLPIGTGLDASDRITVDGDTYEVIGEPNQVVSPREGPHHIEAYLRRVVA